jgi:hypothetical protein
LKNIENQVAWFLAELCKAEKNIQNDKRNQHQAELVRPCLAARPNLLLNWLSCPIEAQCTFCFLKSHPLCDQTGNSGVVVSWLYG